MNLPFSISQREKKYLVYGGIIVVLILGHQAFTWYSDIKKEVTGIADNRLFLLQKQLGRIASKDRIQAELNNVKGELEKQERSLLQGDKPPVAAAALQRFLKDNALSLNIDVKQERTLGPVDKGPYLGIPVEIGFTASNEKFRKLLIELRRSPFLLSVTEIKIRVTNISNPTDIFTTMVVTGFIKKPEEKGGGAKERKNVT